MTDASTPDSATAPYGVPRPPRRAGRALSGFDAVLYATTLVAWGTSWFALKLNASAGVAPEASVFYRFVAAAGVMLVWVLLRGRPLRFSAGLHLRFAVMGGAMFSFNFLLYYFASLSLPSGLLAVIFSLVSLMNMLVAAALARQRPDGRVLVAGVLGVSGIVGIFWPEVVGQSLDGAALGAIGMCLLANALFVTGNMVSAGTQRAGVPVIEANAIGMVWGAALMGLFVLARGVPLTFEWTGVYVGTLIWLALVSSVAAFAAYLTLLGRIGAGRAGYLTVLFPIVALSISTVLEGYQWSLPALVGLALVLVGNGLVIRSARRARP